MQLVIIEDGTVVTIGASAALTMAIEAPNDIICGDLYSNGEFQKIAPRPEPIIRPLEAATEEYLIDLDYRISLIELGL